MDFFKHLTVNSLIDFSEPGPAAGADLPRPGPSRPAVFWAILGRKQATPQRVACWLALALGAIALGLRWSEFGLQAGQGECLFGLGRSRGWAHG